MSALIAAPAVAARLGTTVQTLAKWRMRNAGPAFVKVGRTVHYDAADVDAWITARRQGGDGDA